MMIMPQKQKIASIFVSKLTSKGDSADFVQKMGDEGSYKKQYETGAETMNDSSLALESAASSIIAALEKKDSKALKSALKDFIYLCDESEDATEGEEY
jgi:hypothetical protein